MNQNNLEKNICLELTRFVNKDSRNALSAHGGMKIYDAPLFGIASADDAWFDRFTETKIIGPKFLKPKEWLTGVRSVLSFVLPFTKELRDTNRMPGLPSEEWVSARIDGEAFNQVVRTFLVDLLT
jgi:epoxyqueuosine reductase